MKLKTTIKFDEKAIKKKMIEVASKQAIEVTCPHCHKEVTMKSGELCPKCHNRVTFEFNVE
jgi:predicted nucleic-acid-binding Zn-ribbon protein